MIVVGADLGHNLIKAWALIDGELVGPIVFPHALVPLERGEYRELMDGDLIGSGDILNLNGHGVIIGQSAEAMPTRIVRKEGIMRWADPYYVGASLSGALVSLLPDGCDEPIKLVASYPPGDHESRRMLAKALTREWNIEVLGTRLLYTVERTQLGGEPVFGLMNRMLNDKGDDTDNTMLDDATMLWIDIGGGTTSFVPITEGGNVVYNMADSFPLGIYSVMEHFEKILRSDRQTREIVMGTRKIAPDILRDGLRTGLLPIGGDYIQVHEQRDKAFTPYLRSFRSFYDKYGGSVNFKLIGLTGGGFVSMYESLTGVENPSITIRKPGGVLRHKSVITATDDLRNAHLANSMGMLKTVRGWIAEGLLK